MEEIIKQEKLVDQYVQQERIQETVELLFKLIVTYAQRKDFVKAEALREKLFEVDSMALNEIIKSAEIIEAEKSESLDSDHMEIWSEMYDKLSIEEKNIFYFSLQKQEFNTDDVIFQQGEKNNKLWFIDQGQLKLVCSQKGVEQLIKTLEPGDIAGKDTFFSITVCTTSLIALSHVKLNYLDMASFVKWQTAFPKLATQLEKYCATQEKNADLLQKKGINRREHKRIKITGPIRFQILNTSGKAIGKSFKGELADISIGGLSFYIKTSNKKNALMLLGRKVNVKFTIPMGSSGIETIQKGTITGVIKHLLRDYSIHMKFDNLLSKLVIEDMNLLPNSKDSSDNHQIKKPDKAPE